MSVEIGDPKSKCWPSHEFKLTYLKKTKQKNKTIKNCSRNLNKTKSSSSSSSCRATSTDIPDPLSPLFPIVHRFRATSRILTELLYVFSSWSSCFPRPYEGAHRKTSLMSSPLLLQLCLACLVRLALIVFVVRTVGSV